DVAPLREKLAAAAKSADAHKRARNIILENPEISPSLKKFVGNAKMWNILKPGATELVFLIELDRKLPLLTADQFRDALLVGREIQKGKG
ncbi:MAG TPA: hypothetical protein VM492_12855, partial [Sumerlaeia bacterium]|nr:hypothetical protein [Sumerlaeia bacterium]